ncbi:MAG: response regulator transcription factor [Arachidicoccus sp.]|nr:response regulator transcription factor [Arachidicoccus sp.]
MDLKPKKILIADDEPDILEIISYNLKKEEYDVYTAKDGIEAVDKAKDVKPDLVILDMMMPYKNGLEVCEILRAQPAHEDTLIMFLTAINDDSTEIKGLETGADDYITKPVSPKVLTTRVNALFRRKQKNNDDDNKILEIDNLKIDPVQFLVFVDGSEVVLAKKNLNYYIYWLQLPDVFFCEMKY